MNQESPVSRASSNAREAELLLQVAAGNRHAFESLYGAYYGRLTRFLARLTWRHELIEEVINDTFWVVWQKAGDFRGHSLVSTWILGIAYRCGLKALRRAGAAAEAWPEDDVPASDDAQERRLLEDWVARGLDRLSADQRLTLELAYYFGHSVEEIAEIMECSASTVKARMFRARIRLRNILPELGDSQGRQGS